MIAQAFKNLIIYAYTAYDVKQYRVSAVVTGFGWKDIGEVLKTFIISLRDINLSLGIVFICFFSFQSIRHDMG